MQRWLFALLFLPAIAIAQTDWSIRPITYGEAVGETTVQVEFPHPLARSPLVFGIPVGRAESAAHVSVYDETGNVVDADITALGNWQSQPARWALVSTVIDPPRGGTRRTLTIRWGAQSTRSAAASVFAMRAGSNDYLISNSDYALRITPESTITITPATAGAEAMTISSGLYQTGGEILRPENGDIRVLFNGRLRKHIRITTRMNDSLELHREMECYANSPYIKYTARFINRSIEDIPLTGIMPFRGDISGITESTLGLAGSDSKNANRFSLRQDAFGWSAAFDGLHEFAEGNADDLGEWVKLETSTGPWLCVFPLFQQLAAGEPTLASAIQFDGSTLMQRHYAPMDPTADVRLREGMARTFTTWIVAGAVNPANTAEALKALPSVIYDRAHLTAMGCLPEETVSHRFDDATRNAARYFLHARIGRAEYPRSSRGTEDGPDKSGEGMHEVNLHAGGMVYGDVFQYYQPQPAPADVAFYHDELGIAMDHVRTGGRYTYRNGDIVNALALHAMRFGDADMWQFLRDHAQVYADVSISHADASNGLGHYYCDWYANPYVYQRFEGLLRAALLTGDPWWFETAQAMAGYCVAAWKDGAPRDGRLAGGTGAIQSRSSYIAKMLLLMYDTTGETRYADTAIRLAQWSIATQDQEGWWTMDPTDPESRAYRNSPIFAGYVTQGLWPVYTRTGNADLLAALLKCMDYHWARMQGQEEPLRGALPNSYWYGDTTKESDPIVPNLPATAQFAGSFVEAYSATGKAEYLEAAKAAWNLVLANQSDLGGLPLSPGPLDSVWSVQIVEDLPRFGAILDRVDAQADP